MWRRPANSSHVRVLESGHLIPQEKPSIFGAFQKNTILLLSLVGAHASGFSAKELHEFLSSRYGTQRSLL